MTALESFNFTQFKTVMGVSNIDEATYGLILRAIFARLKTVHSIDLNVVTDISEELVYAIYRHAKFIFEVHKGNLDVIKSTADSSGNRTKFDVETPSAVTGIYKMYSPDALAFL